MKFMLALFAAFCGFVCYEAANGSGHWCCTVEVKPEFKEMNYTKAVPDYKQIKLTETVGYEECFGVDGESTYCPVTNEKIVNVTRYRIKHVHELREMKGSCPHDKLDCCDGYVKYKDNCYGNDEIEQVKLLDSLGLLG
ncbi:uncharacterized protein LOC141899792 [Tubulanus polymorphus]|uniref:uncharacterized protein LOC141899792 n=1 Tax=Tubulanus polymorphus TaxID=672921 RepID=UPI003DA2E4B7